MSSHRGHWGGKDLCYPKLFLLPKNVNCLLISFISGFLLFVLGIAEVEFYIIFLIGVLLFYHQNCLFISFVSGMNGVQLYTIVHFGGDIVRLKIESIISYVGGSTKLTSLRAHSSYEDLVTLLEETSKICCEGCKLHNFVHGCAYANSTHPFTYGLLMSLRVPSQNSQNFIYDLCSLGKGLSTTKDTGSGRGLSTTKVRRPLRHNSFPDPEHEYRGYPETNDKGLDPRKFEPLVDDE
ncbi:hypothetical protein GIB67_003377, partial [Kingdonia uniflora]